MAHQSLYRRYRPRTFAEIRGQDHVVRALQNAINHGTEGHAYLFSGPRGTGKTSTARILAKALNCENLTDGQPCAVCESCLSIENGSSYDLFELDAASNNGVEAMRELVARTAVGSPGRTKVYILDEVHMLSPSASNALLKTLEEPPPHVVFVLATTDPQKVLATIRSRTQHFPFGLLSATELADYVTWIIEDAELEVDADSVADVVRQGRGSARDTLSALDMVVAAGGTAGGPEPIDAILSALVSADAGAALGALSDAIGLGREPKVLAESLVVTLRDAFLAAVGGDLRHLSDEDQALAAANASALGAPRITRALEMLGAAMVDMRQATEPRVPLDVALIRVCDAGEVSTAALLERIERLESALADGSSTPSPSPSPAVATSPKAAATSPKAAATSPAAPSRAANDGGGGPSQARAAIAARRDAAATSPSLPAPAAAASSPPRPPAPPAPPPPGRRPPSQSAPAAAEPASAAPTPTPTPAPTAATSPSASSASSDTSPLPPVSELSDAMSTSVLGTLKGMSKAIFSGGHFVALEGEHAVFALSNEPTRERAENSRAEVEAALAAHFGRPVPLLLIADSVAHGAAGAATRAAVAPEARTARTPAASAPGAPAASAASDPVDNADGQPDDESFVDVSDLEDAHVESATGLDKVIDAFPGAKMIEEDQQ